MVAPTGADTRYYYDYQSSFGGAVDGQPLPFGSNATADTLEGSHQAVRVFEPNDREAQEIIEQMFDGQFTVNFELTNPFWLSSVISAIDTDSPTGTGPYTYDWNKDNPAEQVPRPFTIYRAVDKSSYTDDLERQAVDCVVSTATINIDVGGNVSVTLTGGYANDSKSVSSVGNLGAQPSDAYRTMTFAEATFTTDVGGTPADVSRIQATTMNINNNVDMVGELGSKTAVDFSPKARNSDVEYTKLSEDDTELSRFYGGNSSVGSAITNDYQIDLSFTAADSTQNDLTISIGGNFPNEYAENGVGDPASDFEGQLSEMAKTVSATATTANQITDI